MTAPTWIAEEEVLFVHPDGRHDAGRIAVAMPMQVSPQEARCAVALDGLESLRVPISGNSTMQALLLGLRFLGTMLHDFRSKGGRVMYPDGLEEMDLDASFGPLLRNSPAGPD